MHDQSALPAGFRLVQRKKTICGRSLCFGCFDLYCERCEAKDLVLLELGRKCTKLDKYVTQLQDRLTPTDKDIHSEKFSGRTSEVHMPTCELFSRPSFSRIRYSRIDEIGELMKPADKIACEIAGEIAGGNVESDPSTPQAFHSLLSI